MPVSALFEGQPGQTDKLPVSVEGFHQPDALASASGLWISSAGSAMLTEGVYALKPQVNWLLIMCQNGSFHISTNDLRIRSRESCLIPAGTQPVSLQVD